jgi:hypothetical protein
MLQLSTYRIVATSEVIYINTPLMAALEHELFDEGLETVSCGTSSPFTNGGACPDKENYHNQKKIW